MIANIIYYTNHYDSLAEILEGNLGKTALLVNAYEFKDPSYFSSTYGSQNHRPHLLSSAAEILYAASYESLLSYSVFYNRLSYSGLLPSYLLQEGNNLRMRQLLNDYLQLISSTARAQDLIIDLGYTST